MSCLFNHPFQPCYRNSGNFHTKNTHEINFQFDFRESRVPTKNITRHTHSGLMQL